MTALLASAAGDLSITFMTASKWPLVVEEALFARLTAPSRGRRRRGP
jgi:hypothetical protein